MTEDESRKQFEAWISAPPFEYDVERYTEHSAWPGSYMNLGTDLAWQAWQAAHTGHTVAYGLFWKSNSTPNAAKLMSDRLHWDLESARQRRSLQLERNKIEIREIRVTVGEVVE
jgi:hypothetical protein